MLNEHAKTGVKTARFRLKAAATTNTYAYCRIAARDALKQAEKAESGALYFCMMAGVFSAFTVEAFLNHLGRQKVPDWDKKERRLGPLQKMHLLASSRGWVLDFGKRPFQTFRSMLSLRDSLAHGKTEEVLADVVMRRPPTDDERWPEPHWKRLCTVSNAKLMVHDAEAIVKDLSLRSGSSRNPFANLGHGWSGVDEVAHN